MKVGPDVTLPPNLRLQDTPQKDEFDDDEEEDEEADIPGMIFSSLKKKKMFKSFDKGG